MTEKKIPDQVEVIELDRAVVVVATENNRPAIFFYPRTAPLLDVEISYFENGEILHDKGEEDLPYSVRQFYLERPFLRLWWRKDIATQERHLQTSMFIAPALAYMSYPLTENPVKTARDLIITGIFGSDDAEENIMTGASEGPSSIMEELIEKNDLVGEGSLEIVDYLINRLHLSSLNLCGCGRQVEETQPEKRCKSCGCFMCVDCAGNEYCDGCFSSLTDTLDYEGDEEDDFGDDGFQLS